MLKAIFWLPLPRYFVATGRVSRLQYFAHMLILFAASWTMSVAGDAIGRYIPGNRGKNKYGPDPLQSPQPPIEVF